MRLRLRYAVRPACAAALRRRFPGRYAIVTYHRLDTGIDIDVETFRSRAAGQAEGFPVRVRTATGQDVVILFHAPARPGAALIRKARAALMPIPARVTFP